MHVLLQFVPKSIDIPALVKAVEALPEIKNLHHVHVWQLDEHAIHFEAHVDLQKNLPVTETHAIQLKITDLLKSDFDIGHITLQFEHGLHEHTSPIQ
jgi:cobalt-zinc-cadmium efflux system protein